MPMNHKDHALRMAAKAFMIIRFGGYLTADEAKTFCDLCCLALPMKYRFPRAEIDAIRVGIEQALLEQFAASKEVH